MNDRDRYGKFEADWLHEQINDFWEDMGAGFDCIDNLRLCRKGDVADEARYDEIERDGCCGSHNTEFGPSPEGHFYLYGFNYGH